MVEFRFFTRLDLRDVLIPIPCSVTIIASGVRREFDAAAPSQG